MPTIAPGDDATNGIKVTEIPVSNETLLIPDLGPTITQAWEQPHYKVCYSQTPHHFPENFKLDWPSKEVGKQILIQTFGPEVEAQSTAISVVDKVTEIQVQVPGTKKRKATTSVYPDLRDQALQEFLASSAPVLCDEILQTLSPEKSGEVRKEKAKTPRRKVARYKQKSESTPNEHSGKESDTQLFRDDNNQVFGTGEEAALIKPPTQT